MIKRQAKKAEPDRDENGQIVLTERYVKSLCEENDQYTTPHLNDVLYLHYKGKSAVAVNGALVGFARIQNLESYYNVKSLWLEVNGINKISGL